MFKNLFKKNNSFPPKEENVNVKEQESFAGKIETVHDKKKIYKMEELLPDSKFLSDEEEREIMQKVEAETTKESLMYLERAIEERKNCVEDESDFRIPDAYEAYRHPMDFYLQGTKYDN